MSTKKQTKPTEWEIKDRNYYLTGNESPLTYTIPSKHTKNIHYCGLMNQEDLKENLSTQQTKHLSL